MKRLRLVFLVVTVVLLVPIVLLVHWALDNVAVEAQGRHRAIAERVFDEMEREIGDLLEQEEERPFGEYSYLYAPEGSIKAAFGLRRSPLAEEPDRPYVVGYFQIDPDGTFTSPRVPRDPEYAKRRNAWEPSAATEAEVTALYELVSGRWESIVRQAGTQARLRNQRPGTTVTLTKKLVRRQQKDRHQQAETAAAPQSTFDSFGPLNKALRSRLPRTGKVAQVPAQNVYPQYAQGRQARTEVHVFSGDELDDKDGEMRQAAVANERLNVNKEAGGWRDVGWTAPAPKDPTTLVAVQLEPMVTALLDDDHVVLYRTVFSGEKKAHRQGLVINIPTLTAELASVVVGDTELAQFAKLRFITNGGAAIAVDPGLDYVYLHRFAEPFAVLAAELRLAPLPADAGATYIYALAALLILVGTVGLFALYRMVSVVVGFAERRSNFVSAVTHELKTPLTSIRMYGEMLRDGMVDTEEKRQQYYETITAEAERLTRLINNVLELSRLEKKSRPMVVVSGSPSDVLRQALDIVGPHATKQGFTLQLDVEEGLPAVAFDRDALLQVVLNLVDNAFKYAASAADKTIRLSARRDGKDVVLSVRDHGPGVASEHLGHVFEPFYRGENELTRKTKGTGIGLALVRGLVDRMGGKVTGKNVPDGGFQVDIALGQSAA
ncbi:MAG: HAMP domain-containing sensor histidine kinase [Myxococcota bacterium]